VLFFRHSLSAQLIFHRYFIITNLANGESEVIRYAALLRGTESAWQAISYGLTSVTIFSEVGAIYINFALWALAIFPAWQVLKHFGQTAKLIPQEEEAVRSGDGKSSQ
jgi:hypothetical protein